MCLQLIMLGVSKSTASDCICQSFHQLHALYHCLRIPHPSPGPPKTASLIPRRHVRAVPRSSWSLSISTSSSPTTDHQVEEEDTLLATPTASLTETLAMNFNEVQRRGIRNDASPSPTLFHWTTSTGPREAAWLP